MLVKGLAPNGTLKNIAGLVTALTEYSRMIEPWAYSVSAFMLADVARKDARMWHQHSKEMGKELRREVTTAPTGEALRRLQSEQVTLITSLPAEAAQRVHALAQESTITGVRASELAKQILETEDVTAARARLIARTEVSRAASNLVQARAEWAGSDGYIWRTSGDGNVRDSHKEMEGKYVRWSQPPTLDKMVGHAGCLPNCRCFAEPVFSDN
jgi:SPP1 gp7 family putative phage head morphogenesis protein